MSQNERKLYPVEAARAAGAMGEVITRLNIHVDTVFSKGPILPKVIAANTILQAVQIDPNIRTTDSGNTLAQDIQLRSKTVPEGLRAELEDIFGGLGKLHGTEYDVSIATGKESFVRTPTEEYASSYIIAAQQVHEKSFHDMRDYTSETHVENFSVMMEAYKAASPSFAQVALERYNRVTQEGFLSAREKVLQNYGITEEQVEKLFTVVSGLKEYIGDQIKSVLKISELQFADVFSLEPTIAGLSLRKLNDKRE